MGVRCHRMAIQSPEMATWRTLDDAAKQSGVSRRTLQRWVSKGLLTPYARMGDKRLWVDLDQIRKLKEPQPRKLKGQP